MSITFGIPIAGPAGSIVVVGIAGVVVVAGAALAVGAMALTGAGLGAGEIATGMALERQRQHLLEVAGRDPLHLRIDRLALRKEYASAMQEVLARAPWQRLEGGELVMADGSARPLVCAVRSAEGFLFSVAAAADGGLELFSFGDAGRKAAWSTYLRAIGDVVRTRLAGDGWRPVPTTSSRQICKLERTNAGTDRRDELIATYDASSGQILLQSHGWQGRSRRPLRGAECVNVDSLKAVFTQTVPVAAQSIEDGGGAGAGPALPIHTTAPVTRHGVAAQ